MTPADDDKAGFNSLLDYLKRSRGFDFTGYKRSTLGRRIDKRMAEVGVEGYGAYQDHLEVNPREFTDLFNTILINVTSFFRDRPAWDHLRDEVIPRLLAARSTGESVRVWSAGCASGEEAYSVAMLLAEAMGEAEFKNCVKIYATDVDEDALQAARHAVYSNDALKEVPGHYVERYFEPNTSGLQFRPDLRRAVIFGRNDLVQDAPISRIHLLLCRNVLMYFTADTQARILERFNFGLMEAGFLFLGKSEMLITHGDLFAPEDLKHRVFRKVVRDNLRERLQFLGPGQPTGHEFEGHIGLRAGAAALAPIPQIAVDRAGYLADANMRARELFQLGVGDVGRPFQDLSISYRPTDLRSAIEETYETGAAVSLGRVPYDVRGEKRRILDVHVAPILGGAEGPIGATITFQDVTAFAQLHDDYERSKRELETAYEELQSTVEELETTNEELQSTNEELETTNEELQSTNEELETMNEELQSTNDELETMNTEINSRAGDLDRLNLFFEGILTSLGVGVVVVDRARKIQVWNAGSDDLWGVRSSEVEGEDFLKLDIGLAVADLAAALADALGGDRVERELPARNRRGKDFRCRVRILPLVTAAKEIYGAVILMADTADGGAMLPEPARR